MLNMKPIPINCKTIATANTVSPNGKYTACINKTSLFPKITIVDNSKVYFADKKPKHFQHDFFSTTKIYALQFNSSSDKLYCLAKKKQQSKLYQFSLIETEDQPKSSTWQKQSSISIASEANYFSINETSQDLMVVFLKNNELLCNTIDIESSFITESHDIPKIKEKIIDVKFDAANRIIYAYLENESLIVLSEADKKWEIKHRLNNCPSLPHCYSKDGNTLVFINNSNLQIRYLSSENPDKIVSEISYDTYKGNYKRITIKDACINSQGSQITALVMRSQGKYLSSCLFSSTIKKFSSTWLIDNSDPFYLFANISLANNYYGKVASYYVNPTNTKVLVERSKIYFHFGKPNAELRITNTEKLKKISNIIRESNRMQYEYERSAQNRSSSSSNSNSLFRYASYSLSNSFSMGDDGSSCCHDSSYSC